MANKVYLTYGNKHLIDEEGLEYLIDHCAPYVLTKKLEADQEILSFSSVYLINYVDERSEGYDQNNVRVEIYTSNLEVIPIEEHSVAGDATYTLEFPPNHPACYIQIVINTMDYLEEKEGNIVVETKPVYSYIYDTNRDGTYDTVSLNTNRAIVNNKFTIVEQGNESSKFVIDNSNHDIASINLKKNLSILGSNYINNTGIPHDAHESEDRMPEYWPFTNTHPITENYNENYLYSNLFPVKENQSIYFYFDYDTDSSYGYSISYLNMTFYDKNKNYIESIRYTSTIYFDVQNHQRRRYEINYTSPHNGYVMFSAYGYSYNARRYGSHPQFPKQAISSPILTIQFNSAATKTYYLAQFKAYDNRYREFYFQPLDMDLDLYGCYTDQNEQIVREKLLDTIWITNGNAKKPETYGAQTYSTGITNNVLGFLYFMSSGDLSHYLNGDYNFSPDHVNWIADGKTFDDYDSFEIELLLHGDIKYVSPISGIVQDQVQRAYNAWVANIFKLFFQIVRED